MYPEPTLGANVLCFLLVVFSPFQVSMLPTKTISCWSICLHLHCFLSPLKSLYNIIYTLHVTTVHQLFSINDFITLIFRLNFPLQSQMDWYTSIESLHLGMTQVPWSQTRKCFLLTQPNFISSVFPLKYISEPSFTFFFPEAPLNPRPVNSASHMSVKAFLSAWLHC